MENTEKRSYDSPRIEVVGALVDHILGLHIPPTQLDNSFPQGTPFNQLTFS